MENFDDFSSKQSDNDLEMGESHHSEGVKNLGNAAVESVNVERTPAQYDGKSVKEKVAELELWLDGRRYELDSEVNDIWRRIEDGGHNPNNSNEYRSKEQENKKALNDARDTAFSKLLEAFPGSDSKEFGKIYGETVRDTGFLTRMEGFKHFSKEARLGVMEKFDFYNYAKLFKEKGSDLYELIKEKVFGGELSSDEDDMAWDIRAGTIANKNKEPVKCIYIGQSFREEQYDDEGHYTGDQWFSSQGGIFINLSNFKDIRMIGRCSKEMKEQFERAKSTDVKNVQDLFEGGIEALVQ